MRFAADGVTDSGGGSARVLRFVGAPAPGEPAAAGAAGALAVDCGRRLTAGAAPRAAARRRDTNMLRLVEPSGSVSVSRGPRWRSNRLPSVAQQRTTD